MQGGGLWNERHATCSTGDVQRLTSLGLLLFLFFVLLLCSFVVSFGGVFIKLELLLTGAGRDCVYRAGPDWTTAAARSCRAVGATFFLIPSGRSRRGRTCFPVFELSSITCGRTGRSVDRSARLLDSLYSAVRNIGLI